MKKAIAILLAVCLVLTLTASAVSAGRSNHHSSSPTLDVRANVVVNDQLAQSWSNTHEINVALGHQTAAGSITSNNANNLFWNDQDL